MFVKQLMQSDTHESVLVSRGQQTFSSIKFINNFEGRIFFTTAIFRTYPEIILALNLIFLDTLIAAARGFNAMKLR